MWPVGVSFLWVSKKGDTHRPHSQYNFKLHHVTPCHSATTHNLGPFTLSPPFTTSALRTAPHPPPTSPLVPPVPSPADFPYKYHRSHVLLPYLTLQPMKMEPIDGSETSAIINQTPGNYPKESLLYSVHGESLKSRKVINTLMPRTWFWLWCKHPHG